MVREGLARDMECAFRKHANEEAADFDRLGCHFATVFRVVLVLFKCLLRNGHLGLALRHGSAAISLQAAALLISRRRNLYVRFREPILTAVLAHCAWGVVSTGINMVPGPLHEYGHSPLLLFMAMQMVNASVMLCGSVLYARPLLHWNLLALPLVALLPLWHGGDLCRRVLAVPGGGRHVASLYSFFETVHAAAHPAAAVSLIDTADPQQQCMVVNAWSLVLLGVLLPLYVTYRLELPARKLFYCSWVGQIEGPASGTAQQDHGARLAGQQDEDAVTGQQEQGALAARRRAALSPLPGRLRWWFQLQPAAEAGAEAPWGVLWLSGYLYSSLVWTAAGSLLCLLQQKQQPLAEMA